MRWLDPFTAAVLAIMSTPIGGHADLERREKRAGVAQLNTTPRAPRGAMNNPGRRGGYKPRLHSKQRRAQLRRRA